MMTPRLNSNYRVRRLLSRYRIGVPMHDRPHAVLQAEDARDADGDVSSLVPPAHLGVEALHLHEVGKLRCLVDQFIPSPVGAPNGAHLEDSSHAPPANHAGTAHTGTFRSAQGDIPASGNRVAPRYASVKLIQEGKVALEHLYFDQLEFVQQIGALPPAQARGRGETPAHTVSGGTLPRDICGDEEISNGRGQDSRRSHATLAIRGD